MSEALVPLKQSPRSSASEVAPQQSDRTHHVDLDVDEFPIVFSKYIHQYEKDTVYYSNRCGSEAEDSTRSLAPSTVTPPPKRPRDDQILDPNSSLRKKKIVAARD